jgi:hypothetical protein
MTYGAAQVGTSMISVHAWHLSHVLTGYLSFKNKHHSRSHGPWSWHLISYPFMSTYISIGTFFMSTQSRWIGHKTTFHFPCHFMTSTPLFARKVLFSDKRHMFSGGTSIKPVKPPPQITVLFPFARNNLLVSQYENHLSAPCNRWFPYLFLPGLASCEA